MRFWKNIVWATLLIPALMTSCIQEDLDDCPNITLYFSYWADGDHNVISQYMDQVDLYVFDESGNLVEKRTYGQGSLGSNIAVPSFKLTPGVRYRMVAVGNPHSMTQVTGLDARNLNNTYIQSPDWDNATTVANHDHNYMGEKEVMIPTGPHRMYNDTIRLYSSHIDVDIWVKGLPAPAQGSSMPYTVSIERTNEQTNFHNDINLAAKGTCVPSLSYDTEEGCYHTTDLAIFRLDMDGTLQTSTCDQDVVVRDGGGTEMARFSLYDFLQYYKAYIDVTRQEAYLPIEIIFQTGITIRPPVWMVDEVIPDWQNL